MRKGGSDHSESVYARPFSGEDRNSSSEEGPGKAPRLVLEGEKKGTE